MHSDHLRRVMGGLIVLAMLIGSAAYAQDDDEDTGYIYGVRAEILFPSAVRFFVGVNVPPQEIVSADLTVRQENDDWERTFEVSPDDHIFEDTGAAAQLVYAWELTGDPLPDPFSTLSYTWVVTTQDGTVSQADGETFFEDVGRGKWQMGGEPPVILHWTNENLAGESMWNDVMSTYDLLTRRAGLSPTFEFAIYDPGVRLCQTVTDPETDAVSEVVIAPQDDAQFPCSRQDFERVYAAAGISFIQRPTFGYAELQNLLVAAMVRQTYASLWQDVTVPDWFVNGLAFLYRAYPMTIALETARGAARTEALIDLDALERALPEDAPLRDRALWESESYLLVLYLADRYGAETPFNLARAVPDVGFPGALQNLTGSGQAELWDAWTRWLFTRAAERAVEWTPYLSTTPTVTPTATNTLPPPTPTASHTPTETMAPTSTFLGDQPATVRVMEATVTPTRAQPTNTPLPPGSLPTMVPHTPAPVVAPDESGSDPAVIGGAVVLVVAVLTLIVVVVAFIRRRRV